MEIGIDDLDGDWDDTIGPRFVESGLYRSVPEDIECEKVTLTLLELVLPVEIALPDREEMVHYRGIDLLITMDLDLTPPSARSRYDLELDPGLLLRLTGQDVLDEDLSTGVAPVPEGRRDGVS